MHLATQLLWVSAACSGALALGVLLTARHSISRWAFAIGMLVLAAESSCNAISTAAESSTVVIYWQQWRLIALSLLPPIWSLFSLCYARDDARNQMTKWRWLIPGAFLLSVVLAVSFRSDLIYSLESQAGGYKWAFRLGWAGYALYVTELIASVCVVMNLERTFRASIGTMRWRIKFMLLGVGLLFVVRLYTSSQALLYRGVDLSLENTNTVALLIAVVLILRTLFRTGHFELVVYPSQSVLQNSLTALLAGIYLLIVGVFANVVTKLGGDSAFALKAFLVLPALVILALLLQSDRVRLYLRRFVNRHFERPVHDYRTVWRKFTESTASRVEQADLCRSFVRLVGDVFQALSVTIWLVDENKETVIIAASTSLSEARAREFKPQKAEVSEVISHFRDRTEPADIESSKENWATTLRQWHPTEFPQGGARVCVPIIGHGEVLGLITVGDRVNGVAFTLQDFEMLKCASYHIAASLLNVQLSQKLLQSKELEAFQTMAAFFTHDLKNAASTLNLMLQNLPVHFDNPAFREDALRGIAKTVSHINGLIGRLSLLRHELEIKLAESDLNEVIAQAISGIEQGAGTRLKKDLRALPRIMLDGEQIGKVVTNLVLNATEAVAKNDDGAVRLTTEQLNVWAVLTVADNGCGMSEEFRTRSLFRPFQTTKKSGLGIGLFQSKMIVESHGGRIAVASEPGKGTTFQVYLPLARQTK
jgi:putative PEP-CTERM system histidine kinase